MTHVLYHAAPRHRRFTEMASAVLESHFIDAPVVPRKTYRKISDALADDSDPRPDPAVAGAWITTTSTTSTTNLGPFLGSARADARIAGSSDPVVAVTYREVQGAADAIASMSLDDLGRILALVAVQHPEGVSAP
jgi:hypothetical protein